MVKQTRLPLINLNFARTRLGIPEAFVSNRGRGRGEGTAGLLSHLSSPYARGFPLMACGNERTLGTVMSLHDLQPQAAAFSVQPLSFLRWSCCAWTHRGAVCRGTAPSVHCSCRRNDRLGDNGNQNGHSVPARYAWRLKVHGNQLRFKPCKHPGGGHFTHFPSFVIYLVNFQSASSLLSRPGEFMLLKVSLTGSFSLLASLAALQLKVKALGFVRRVPATLRPPFPGQPTSLVPSQA